MDRTVKILFASVIALLFLYGIAIVLFGTYGPRLLEVTLLLTGLLGVAAIIVALRRSIAANRNERRALPRDQS